MREKSGTFLLRNCFRHLGDRSWILFLLKASYVRLSNNRIAVIIRIQLSTAAAKLLADQRFLVGNGCSCDESVFDGTAAYINRTQKHKDFFTWAIPGHSFFIFFSSRLQLTDNYVQRFYCRCRDSNRRYLVWEATALPTANQPRPQKH